MQGNWVGGLFFEHKTAYEMRSSEWSSDVCASDLLTEELDLGRSHLYVAPSDRVHALEWMRQGYTEAMKTPDQTLIFVTRERRDEIRKDQTDCMGRSEARRVGNECVSTSRSRRSPCP